ncbi:MULTISPECIES: hypothetical protein [Paenibacillus]|uniref:Uncharacterized protein n=1 Tax=Paenibacillus albilobatus TaxID=2716884 RepID=A0A919XNH7_9BACL|nr:MULTISPECIES: hypothetical protein [Paenibacillus]GIO34658.1 hypothetical protein J2TS6_57990 [Paenibacillus albilobatus]
MIKIEAIKKSEHYVELYPGEENVEWLFEVLFNKLEYSVPERLLKGTDSEETGYQGYLKVQLKNGETFEEFIKTLKQGLPVIPDIEQSMDGYTLYLTKPFLK